MTLISPLLCRIGTGYEGINQTHIQSKLKCIRMKWEMDCQRFWEYRDSMYCPWYKSRLVCFCSKLNLKDGVAWRSVVYMDGKLLVWGIHILCFPTVFGVHKAVSGNTSHSIKARFCTERETQERIWHLFAEMVLNKLTPIHEYSQTIRAISWFICWLVSKNIEAAIGQPGWVTDNFAYSFYSLISVTTCPELSVSREP